MDKWDEAKQAIHKALTLAKEAQMSSEDVCDLVFDFFQEK